MADTLFRNYGRGHWFLELVHVSPLTSVSQRAVKLLLWEGKTCHLHYISAVISLVVSWVSFWQFWEVLRHSTCLLVASFCLNCSVALSLMPSICCLFVIVFIWVSSGDSKQLSSNSLSRSVTICSYVPFSKWAWFFDFFRCGGILAFMNCSMIAWAITLIASLTNFWSSSKHSINFRFAGLKTRCGNLCFAVTVGWHFRYFLQNTVRISPNFSLLGLVMFLKVSSVSPRLREWK